MKRTVMIATPAYGGMLTDKYVQSLLETQREMMVRQIPLSILILSNESLINRGRNKCAQMALNGKITDLFFIDADIGWKFEDFYKILTSKNHIVGGTYPMKMRPMNLNYNFLPQDRNLFQNYHIKTVDNLKEIAEHYGNEEVPVQHVPTGFMRISRPVLNKLKSKVQPYHQQNPRTGEMEEFWEFFPTGVKSKNLMSEDWYFCEICGENKIPIFLNTTVVCHHVGTYDYGEDLG